MSKIRTFISLLKTPTKLAQPLGRYGLLNWVPDETYVKLLYKAEFGITPNLKEPKSFNEKIQWLKLHDRNPIYSEYVDKITAKKKIGEIIGPEYIVPMLDQWERADEIDFSSLPYKCVLKCNHDQGSTIIYERGKTKPDEVKKHFSKCLKRNPYRETREWPYKNIVPKIMCEPFLAEDIIDYKLFCFNGKARIINVGQKGNIDHITRVTFLDMNWKQLPFQRSDYERIKELPERPKQLDSLVGLAETIAKNTRFVRVDFFIVGEEIYFSEYTLFPTTGLIHFLPQEGDMVLGEYIEL